MKAGTILRPRRPRCRDRKRNAANGSGSQAGPVAAVPTTFLLMFFLRRRRNREGQPHIRPVSAMLGRRLYLLSGDRLQSRRTLYACGNYTPSNCKARKGIQ